MEPVTALFNAQPRLPGNRTGKAWEVVDYERLIEGVRRGLAIPELATHIGRPETSVWQRLRRLLPVGQRDCLADQVLAAARAALADPAYDWQAEMLLSPPIVRQEVVRAGLAGLTDDHMVTVAYALLASGGGSEKDLFDELLPRLEDDGLIVRLIDLRAQRAVRASPHSIDEEAAWEHASYWVRGRSDPRDWRRAYPPASEW